MKAKLPEKKLNKTLYREGWVEGINFVADTIIKLIDGSTDDTKTKLDTILTFCKNSIKINKESKTNNSKLKGENI